jgi:hypothetical protein
VSVEADGIDVQDGTHIGGQHHESLSGDYRLVLEGTVPLPRCPFPG